MNDYKLLHNKINKSGTALIVEGNPSSSELNAEFIPLEGQLSYEDVRKHLINGGLLYLKAGGSLVLVNYIDNRGFSYIDGNRRIIWRDPNYTTPSGGSDIPIITPK